MEAVRNGHEVTLTARREDLDITVLLQWHDDAWFVIQSLDEVGNQVKLTQFEKANIKARARRGEDETGR